MHEATYRMSHVNLIMFGGEICISSFLIDYGGL